MNNLYENVKDIIIKEVTSIDRSDIMRTPLVAISSPQNPMYEELREILGPVYKHPLELFPETQSIISYFIPFTKELALSSKNGASDIWAEAYITINNHFLKIDQAVTDYLQTLNYDTYRIAGVHSYDADILRSVWSHRSAAAIAGLGQFGLNNMLISDKGAAGRYCTILTSAPIEISTYRTPIHCGYMKNKSCKICMDSCPVGALSPDGFDRFECHDKVIVNNTKRFMKNIGEADVCGICVSNCPLAYME